MRCLFLLSAFCAFSIDCQRTASGGVNNCEDNVPISVNILQSLERIQQRLERLELQDLSANKIKNHTRSCPVGFNYSVDGIPKCYSVVTRKFSWDAAQAACRQLHPKAHLAVVNSALENQIIQEILNDFDCSGPPTGPIGEHSTNHFWTSGRRTSDSCNSSFIWKAGIGQGQSIGYTNWLDDEPNCHGGREEYCLAFRKDLKELNAQWNDAICSLTFCSVCEVVKYQH